MKIGLMLGGGGAFGAYQVGVIKALIEEKLIDQIEVMSGSSIGAINIVMLMSNLSIDEIEELWTNINNEVIYKGKNPYFRNARKSLVNIGPLYELLTSDLNAETIRQSKIIGYATLKEVKSADLKYQVNYFHGEKKTIKLNDALNPFEVAKGSASVPMLFGSTKIGDSYYVDGGMSDNNPITPLLEEGCSLILAVPLASKLDYKSYENQNVTIVDFKWGDLFSRFHSINMIKSMDFNTKNMHELKEDGYKWGLKIINLLRNLKIISGNQFIIDNQEYKYYNLERLEGEVNELT